MKKRKQKKPSKKMRPSPKKNWGRAVSRYQLSPEELAMAKAVDFTPAMMDELVRGKKIKRGPHDKLPSRPATPSQVKMVKAEIRKLYAARYGTTPPPPVAEPSRSQ